MLNHSVATISPSQATFQVGNAKYHTKKVANKFLSIF